MSDQPELNPWGDKERHIWIPIAVALLSGVAALVLFVLEGANLIWIPLVTGLVAFLVAAALKTS